MTIKGNTQAAIVLEDIRSMENVGSVFRTADAVGVEKLYLCGTTPAPYDKFDRPQPKLMKASLGAEKTVAWQKSENILPVLKKLKKEGYYLVAIELHEKAVNYVKVKTKPKMAFIFGNEVTGISKKVLPLADVIAQIPMRGKKESLNVAVSAGVALYRILGR